MSARMMPPARAMEHARLFPKTEREITPEQIFNDHDHWYVRGFDSKTKSERTFRIEVLRAFPAGFIDTAATSFVIFFAIQVFEMHWAIKAAMLAASSVGQLCSLFIVQLARRFGRAVNILAACIWLISFIGFASGNFFGSLVYA